MFVYQNKNGQICVTFADNKPVESPEYVIAIDKEAKSLYMVSGEIAPMPTQSAAEVAEFDETEIPETPDDEDEGTTEPVTEE